jgi:hypothetical protein
MKNYLAMTEEEFNRFLETASADELMKMFCMGKTHEQIERDINVAERIEHGYR